MVDMGTPEPTCVSFKVTSVKKNDTEPVIASEVVKKH